MSRAILLVGRHVARAPDALVHNRGRRRRIRQFHRVTRVTLVADFPNAASHSPSVTSTIG
jgi:hypothetical protein